MAKKTVLIDGRRYDLESFKSASGVLPEPIVENRISAAVPAPVDEDGEPLEVAPDAPAALSGEEAKEVDEGLMLSGVMESLPPAPKKGKGGRPKKVKL